MNDALKAVNVYRRNVTIAICILLGIFLLIPVFVKSPYILNVFILVFYMSTLSMAWNLLGGMTGQNSLGHAAYMGLGAYVSCLLITKAHVNPWVSAILGMVAVGLVAGIIFFPCFILRGPYFTLVSIAFGEALRQFIINSAFFGRASGVGLPFKRGDSFLDFRFAGKEPYYYIGLAMLILIYLVMKKIERSRMGYALRTIREDEEAAAAIGINPIRYKVMAVVVSAMVAALVGFFYASYTRYIDPELMIQAKSAGGCRRCSLCGGPARRWSHHDPTVGIPSRTVQCVFAGHQHAALCRCSSCGHSFQTQRHSGVVYAQQGEDLL